jgi:hypothetical protein
MVALAGAEAVVADGIAAADDACHGAGREDVETDGLTEVTMQAGSSRPGRRQPQRLSRQAAEAS